MPALKNPAHELFAQALAKGNSKHASYRLSDPARRKMSVGAAAVGANRLLKDNKISERVAELQARKADGIVLSKQWLIEQMLSLALECRKKGAYAVAKACFELLGREYGAFVEHKKITVRRLAEMDEDELKELMNEAVVFGDEEEAQGRRPN
jgi:hypothetical protein